MLPTALMIDRQVHSDAKQKGTGIHQGLLGLD